jgi:hypothetical protein
MTLEKAYVMRDRDNDAGRRRLFRGGSALYARRDQRPRRRLRRAHIRPHVSLPLVIQVAGTFKTEANTAANPLSPVPNPFPTVSFVKIFSGTDFPRWLGNSALT